MRIGFINLWLILVLIAITAGVLMFIAGKLRSDPILNPEDHKKQRIFLLNFILILTLALNSVFTPISTGLLFWIGCSFIIVAGAFYIMSITAFSENKKGLTIGGIYKYTRNPMYIAMLLIFAAFTLMSAQVDMIPAVLNGMVTILGIPVIHYRILNEENFLRKKYNAVFEDYCSGTPRYLFFKSGR